jgi:hypothetical protein
MWDSKDYIWKLFSIEMELKFQLLFSLVRDKQIGLQLFRVKQMEAVSGNNKLRSYLW